MRLSNKKLFTVVIFGMFVFALTSCAPYQARRNCVDYIASGEASWYGPGFVGRKTANGERYNQKGLTAAHPTLPLGTTLRVTNLENGQSVVVRINDRGPYAKGRIIDLSKGAAEKIGMLRKGTASVRITTLKKL